MQRYFKQVNAATKNKRNHRQWRDAMNKWYKATRTASHDDVINHFGGSACLFAIKYTPKARKSKYLGEAARPTLGASKKNKYKTIYHKIATKKGNPKGRGNYNAAVKKYNSGRRAIGAFKAGFFKPARELGKQPRNKGGATLEYGKSASKSFGKKSISGQMRAIAHNAVEGTGDNTDVQKAIVKAMDDVSRTQLKWATDKLKRANQKFAVKNVKKLIG